jgi:hypothetical protein
VKYYVFALMGSLAAAQSVATTYTTDINGNRVAAATVVASAQPGAEEATQITQSINGRTVPMQRTETRVLSKDANGSVVETIVRKYDPNGQVGSTERVVTETQTRPNGSTVHATTYRSDVNGNMAAAERSTVESEKQGGVTTTQSVTERPAPGGSFQAVEKTTRVSEVSGDKTHDDEIVYRRALGSGGDFSQAVRDVKDITHTGNVITETSAHYEPVATASQMRLVQQSQSTTTKHPDGSETSQVNLYGSSWTGNVSDGDAPLALREQDIIERQKGPGGNVTEILSVRRPTPADPNRLGPATKVSETVCTGKCAPDEKAPDKQ